MKKTLTQKLGLLGIVGFLSYAGAVIFAPLAYPGYNWMAQAVSDLSAANALCMMLVGALGMRIVPADYFGVVERFSVFAATGFHAALGIHLFCMKPEKIS